MSLTLALEEGKEKLVVTRGGQEKSLIITLTQVSAFKGTSRDLSSIFLPLVMNPIGCLLSIMTDPCLPPRDREDH